jgi:hypothetical protein
MDGGLTTRPEGATSCVAFAMVSILGSGFLFFYEARSLRVDMDKGLVNLS